MPLSVSLGMNLGDNLKSIISGEKISLIKKEARLRFCHGLAFYYIERSAQEPGNIALSDGKTLSFSDSRASESGL